MGLGRLYSLGEAAQGLGSAPTVLLVLVPLGLVAGLWPLWWLVTRLFRTVTQREQHPVALSRYVLAIVTSVVMLLASAAAFGLALALASYRGFSKKTFVAEVQCIELRPGRLRLYLVPIEPGGGRGATETYDLAGDEWTVGGDVLRFRPWLTAFGVETVYRLSRVEGRWSRAEDAIGHKVTAFDRLPGRTPAWLELYRSGTRGPLSVLVAGAHGGAVSQLPDRLAVFRVYVGPDGYLLEKRAL
jgi:hypothetical protein